MNVKLFLKDRLDKLSNKMAKVEENIKKKEKEYLKSNKDNKDKK